MMNGMKGADEKTEGGAGGGRVGAGGHGGSLTPSLDRVQPTAADSRAFAVAFPQPLAPRPPSPPHPRPRLPVGAVGRAHLLTPVPKSHLVCPLLLYKKKQQ